MLLDGDSSHFMALQLFVKAALAATLVYGLICDVRRLQIPNMITLIVMLLFLFDAALRLTPHQIALHGATGALAFLAGLALFLFGLMGAGDVKLIAALMLWAGPSNGPAFVISMTLIGGAIAAGLLLVRGILNTWPHAAWLIPSRRIRNWASRGIFPYGLAICTAGLILIPSFFLQAN